MLKTIVSRGPSSFARRMARRSDPGPPSFTFVTLSVLAPAVIAVCMNAALFAGFGSLVVPVTPAFVRRLPPETARTSTVTVAVAPLASAPSWHVTPRPTMLHALAPPIDRISPKPAP